MTGASRNAGSKPTLMSAILPIAMNTRRLPAPLKKSDSGIFDVDGEVESGRGKRARPVDQGLQLGLAFARDGDLGAQLVARLADRGVGFAARRVELGGRFVLDERLLVLAGRVEAAAALEVVHGGAQLRSIEREPRFGVVGFVADCLRVFGNGGVVLLTPFEVAAPVQCRGRSATAGQEGRSHERGGGGAQRREESLTTSTPRGGVKVNSLSANPTFSFRFVKEKLEVPPCESPVTRPRSAKVPGSTTMISQSVLCLRCDAGPA